MIDTLSKRLKRDAAAAPESPAGAVIAEALAAADAEVTEYRRLVEQIERDLRGREAGLEARRSALVEGLSRAAAAADLNARARQLIDDDVIPRSSHHRDAALKDLETVSDELKVVRVAIRMQESARDQARLHWSAAVCRTLAPLHRRQVQRIAAALEALSGALVEHGETMDALSFADIMCLDPVHPMPVAGETLRLDRDWSTATLWMRDARAAGLLDG